ncbi:MAG: histidine kinase, partial [Sphingobacteriales bacterium]
MKRSFIILLNIGYWLLYLLLLSMLLGILTAGAVKTTPKQDIIIGFFKIMSMMTIVPGVISFYSFYHYIFNHFLSRKKILATVLFGLLVTLCCGTLAFMGLNFMNKGLLFSHNGWREISMMIAFMSVLCMVHGIIALIIRGFIKWYADIKIKDELQQKNFETELALVKSQLNPHFLFNTINNIDVLIERDARKASLYLNKLSDIMRFMLYEGKAEMIPLDRELTYISKYIDLQKIRNANAAYVQYSVTGNSGSALIAPMLFVPFIENAFKHATNKKENNAIVIKIDIDKN